MSDFEDTINNIKGNQPHRVQLPHNYTRGTRPTYQDLEDAGLLEIYEPPAVWSGAWIQAQIDSDRFK